MLQLNDVEARYGSFKALEKVSMTVGEGELVVLLGANGAGKSTLFNTISGLLKPTAGRISLNGKDVTGLKPSGLVQSGVVQCPEGRKLFPEMSVLKNLMLGAYVHRRDKAAMKKTLDQVLALFPILDEKKDHPAGSLSGGQQQMVAIGRAVMAKPRLLLLDEPSGGLAPQYINEIGTIIQALKDDGATMLMVEQNLALAFKVADRFIILRDGVVSDGGFVKSLEGNHEEIVRTIYL